jgi:hypothetical protein
MAGSKTCPNFRALFSNEKTSQINGRVQGAFGSENKCFCLCERRLSGGFANSDFDPLRTLTCESRIRKVLGLL